MYVEAKSTFKKPKDELLKVIKEPRSLENYHPFCKKNDVQKWPGKGSIDFVEYYSGLSYTREFINWHDNGYDLVIRRKRELAEVNWTVEGNDQSSSLQVRINAKFPNINTVLKWFMWHFYVKFMLQSYINSVLKGFSFFVNSKQKITPNQFGRHSWYS